MGVKFQDLNFQLRLNIQKNFGEIRIFLGRDHLKRYMNAKSVFQKILKNIQDRNDKTNKVKNTDKSKTPGKVNG